MVLHDVLRNELSHWVSPEEEGCELAVKILYRVEIGARLLRKPNMSGLPQISESTVAPQTMQRNEVRGWVAPEEEGGVLPAKLLYDFELGGLRRRSPVNRLPKVSVPQAAQTASSFTRAHKVSL